MMNAMESPLDCLACAACCHQAGGVLLLPDDLRRLAAHFRLSEEEVLLRFTSDGEHIRTRGPKDPSCVFLEGTRCVIYPARPQVCVDYPVGGAACLRSRAALQNLPF